MKKTFTVKETEYTVEDVTAVITCDGEYSEDYRQGALLVTNVADSGEEIKSVVFGHYMPENENDFSNMLEDYSSWDSDYKTLKTVR